MDEPPFQRIAVIGVGLLGGSVGLAAKVAYEGVEIVGVGRRRESLEKALAAGAVDRVSLDAAEGVAGADLVVLATPLGAYEAHLRALRPALGPSAIVTDVGSVKTPVVRTARRVLGRGGRFVGAHPMAGGERTGVEFARANLFAGATCIVTPTVDTPPGLAEAVEGFWRDLGGLTVRRTPAAHDRAVAAVSHLPHVVAALLVALQGPSSLPLAGKGFLDTTRIASGDPAMWREILAANRPAVLAALTRAGRSLARFRALLAGGDDRRVEALLAQAKATRDGLVAARMKRAE